MKPRRKWRVLRKLSDFISNTPYIFPTVSLFWSICMYFCLSVSLIIYSWFHIKGTWSEHSFNGDYLSIPKCTGSCGYLFLNFLNFWYLNNYLSVSTSVWPTLFIVCFIYMKLYNVHLSVYLLVYVSVWMCVAKWI